MLTQNLHHQLRNIPFFERFSETQFDHLIEKGETRDVPAEQVLFEENDPALELFLILKGAVQISGTNVNGEQIDLARLEAGHFFGELALADGGERTASAKTLEDAQFFVLSRQSFIQLLSESPQLLSEVISSISQKIRGSNTQYFEEQLDKQAQLLHMEKERNQLMTQLVTGVAHEFNTPLGIMKTSAHILSDTLQEADLDEETAEDLTDTCQLIDTQVARMDYLIQTFKSISPSEVYAHVSEVRWPEFFGEFERFYRSNSYMELPLEIDLSESAKTLPWMGYAEVLNDILMHLLLNVEIHAYPEGEGKVLIGLDTSGDDFTLTLRDWGRGLDNDTLKQAFSPFFTTQRLQGCTGLGLAVVHNWVVYALQGQIHMISEQGCEVTLRFPQKLNTQNRSNS